MQTFAIHVLGCRVNHYEGEQIATLLRRRGLRQVTDAREADLCVVHTCSVTREAAAKSGQAVRRATRLPVLTPATTGLPVRGRRRTVVTGCWAASDPGAVAGIEGVDAVLGHQTDVAAGLERVLAEAAPGPVAPSPDTVVTPTGGGTFALPLLGDARQSGQQRAYLKVQDGCDAHCTYCIIPRLRPALWSKPVDACVEEARRLVDAGHREIVLTGIFLGAFGRSTALRRRQTAGPSPVAPLANLIEALCARVPGLHRLRCSSLEPGDLTPTLIDVLRSHAQVVPHFHLPLQSGSDAILRRMNRQYRRDDYLRMLDRVTDAFDRPALTTDVIAGFPGETDADFAATLEVVDRARFIHVHAFPFSARPGTAAARWGRQFVPAAVASERVATLKSRGEAHSEAFRRQFLGQTVEILVERPKHPTRRHGRCERYFEVAVEDAAQLSAGQAVAVRVAEVDGRRTAGVLA